MLFAGLKARKQPFLIVADDIDAAGYIYHDLCQIAGEQSVAIFPSGYRRDIKYGQPDQPSRILRTETLDAWHRKNHPTWVVTCPEALAEQVPKAETLSDRTIELKAGKTADMNAICMRLRELGFKEVDYVYEPGQFAVRGSILDVYSSPENSHIAWISSMMRSTQYVRSTWRHSFLRANWKASPSYLPEWLIMTPQASHCSILPTQRLS